MGAGSVGVGSVAVGLGAGSVAVGLGAGSVGVGAGPVVVGVGVGAGSVVVGVGAGSVVVGLGIGTDVVGVGVVTEAVTWATTVVAVTSATASLAERIAVVTSRLTRITRGRTGLSSCTPASASEALITGATLATSCWPRFSRKEVSATSATCSGVAAASVSSRAWVAV